MFIPRQLKKKAANSITSGELYVKTKSPFTESLRPAAPLWHSSTIVAGVKPQKEPDYNDDLLLCGLSLALSDLQRASSNSKQWFHERERSIDGQHGCESPNDLVLKLDGTLKIDQIYTSQPYLTIQSSCDSRLRLHKGPCRELSK